MTSPKENKGSPNFKKRALIATCLLFSVIVVVILIRRYYTPPTTAPEQTSSSIQSTTSVTKPPELPESQYDDKPSNIKEHRLQEADRHFLVEKGLHDPINDLVRDLMRHNELIPCKGVLGGTPGFYNPDRIAVLSKDHVIADWEDGHIKGTIELSFVVSNGVISWTVVHSECGD